MAIHPLQRGGAFVMLTWAMVALLALSTPVTPAQDRHAQDQPAEDQPAEDQHVPDQPVADQYVAVPQPALPDWEDVTAVPVELLAPLQVEVVQAEPRASRRMARLVEWMFSPEGLAFEYDNEATRTVAETLRDRRGNCLSFTLTFVMLAREAGLDARIQETDDVLVWPGSVDSNIVIHAGHVNVGVKIRGQHYTVDFEPNITLSRNEPQEIDDTRALAHFINNRGVEWLERNAPAEALRHFHAAVALEPGFVPGLNNVGVASNRVGDTGAAEQAYLAALGHAPRHLPSLSNLVNLYRQHGETGLLKADKIARYEHRLARAERRDPYRNFVIGLQFERRGDYEKALDAYRRAIRLHRSEAQFHLGLARVHAMLGNEREAGRQLAMAKSMKGRPDSGARDAFRDPYRDLFQSRNIGAGTPMP